MNESDIKKLIQENRHLYWWMPDDQKKNISIDSLVEQILNYGDEKSVKRLLETLGLEMVRNTFYRHIHDPRCNYHPQVINYFKLYFQKHAPGDSHKNTG